MWGLKGNFFTSIGKINELVTWSTFCFNQNRKTNLKEAKNSKAKSGKENDETTHQQLKKYEPHGLNCKDKM